VEIKLPDELWMVGLFAALVMPIYQEFGSMEKSPELFLSAIQALREVHSAGYVHGDIKPANFLVDGKQVLVSDVESEFARA
jgi:serine/threonine protein kinase